MTPTKTQSDSIEKMMHDAEDANTLSRADVVRRFAALELRVQIVERGILENTNITTELRDEIRSGVSKDVKEMVDAFRNLKGGLKVMGWLGTFAKWVAGLAAAFATLYAMVQNIRGVK